MGGYLSIIMALILLTVVGVPLIFFCKYLKQKSRMKWFLKNGIIIDAKIVEIENEPFLRYPTNSSHMYNTTVHRLIAMAEIDKNKYRFRSERLTKNEHHFKLGDHLLVLIKPDNPLKYFFAPLVNITREQ